MVGLNQNSTEKSILMMIERHPYGSVEFYRNMFADLLADAQPDRKDYGDNIIAGFKAALQEWRDYHADAAKEYERLQQKAIDEI